MIVTNKIRVDLERRGMTEVINAVQTDAYSRNVELTLLSGGVPWAVPEGATVQVSYKKPDGTKGYYDTMPDDSDAWSVSGDAGNILTVAIAPQVLTAAGEVRFTAAIIVGSAVINIFPIIIDVKAKPGFGGTSEDYINIGFLPPVSEENDGQVLMVHGGTWQVMAPEGKLGEDVQFLLLSLLKNATYSSDASETIAKLEEIWAADDESNEDTEDGDNGYKVVKLEATPYVGQLPVGTSIGYFLGRLLVIATYSNGTTGISRRRESTEYSVCGKETIVLGENVIEVLDKESGMTAHFTVTGVPVMYSCTVSLKHETEGTYLTRKAEDVESGNSYTATLAIPDDQELVSIVVTMGDEDVTASSVNGMNISIGAVTGDVVVDITVKKSDATFYTVTENLTNVTCSGASSVKENTAYTATLAANDGYEFESVTVTMGGEDVTASVYDASTGTISIASVTGDIVITAVAANHDIEVTMTGISVEYTGGDVPVGTEPIALEGVNVTAHYSDGTTQKVTKFTMTGTINEGSNTIVVKHNGFSAAFNVNGSKELYPALCTVTNNMTGASTNNTLPGVAGGSMYTATITADDGYVLESITVTMGGEDVTASVYDASTGIITIDIVTGNIVITAVAKEA